MLGNWKVSEVGEGYGVPTHGGFGFDGQIKVSWLVKVTWASYVACLTDSPARRVAE